MKVNAIKTSIYRPQENLIEFIYKHIKNKLKEQDVLLITSKIVSLWEGQVIPQNKIDKLELIKKEADIYLSPAAYDCHLTIKEGLLIPSAGIDESNSELKEYILYPKSPFLSAKNIYKELSQKLKLQKWGLIITDSHTQPLRQGVTGVALSYYGIKGVESLIQKKDLFGKSLQFTQKNIVDSLSAAAVLLMGEGAEQKPLALIENAPVEFCKITDNSLIRINPEKDLYYKLYKPFLSQKF